MTVEFDERLFNPIYWEFKELMRNEAVRYVWAKGGSSASKTYSLVQATVTAMLEGTDENTLVLRKIGNDIRDSIYADFKHVVHDWGLGHLFSFTINKVTCVTGSYVRFRGLDDSERIKGLAGFKRIVLEEVTEFDEADLKQLRKRLRGRVGQQFYGLFNPIDEQHWIKTRVFDIEKWTDVPTKIKSKQVNESGDTVVLHTWYKDNYFIAGPRFTDHHVIADFEKDKVRDYNYYRIYAAGEWGRLRTGGEFWKDFKHDAHVVDDLPWDEDQPIRLTWDENVNPYLTCLVWQTIKLPDGNWEARQIDEICLEDPRNRVHHVCREFRERYPLARVKGLFIYGDRTSKREDTKLEKGENFFTLILHELRDYNPRLQLPTANPSIVQSAGFINQCYAGNTSVRIRIAAKCKRSIFDYQYAIEDSDGTLKKTKKTHPTTKVSFEEFGHPSDAKRYLITATFTAEYTAYLTGGKKMNPRIGRPMTKSGY